MIYNPITQTFHCLHFQKQFLLDDSHVIFTSELWEPQEKAHMRGDLWRGYGSCFLRLSTPAGGTKLMILRWRDYAEVFGWAQVNYKGPYK